MELQDEVTQKMFITEDGEEVSPVNVCFKGEGKPYFLYVDEDGNKIVTKMPLIEVEVIMTPEKDPELSSLV